MAVAELTENKWDMQFGDVCLLPGELVTMHVIKLPKMRASERLQAIPNLLEPRLACELETIEIALGDAQSDGALTVAVFEKELLRNLLQKWRAAGVDLNCVLPDYLALTWSPGSWSVVLQNDRALIRTGYQSGFACDANNLITLLESTLNKEAEKKPTRLVCWAESNAIEKLAALNVTIDLHDTSTSNMFDVSVLKSKPAINLLQGKYQSKVQVSLFKRNWRWCGAMAMTVVVFLFLSQVTQWFYLRHQNVVLDTQVKHAYQQLFPGSTDVVEPQFRARALLKRLQGANKTIVSLGLKIEKQQTVIAIAPHHLQFLLNKETCTFDWYFPCSKLMAGFDLSTDTSNIFDVDVSCRSIVTFNAANFSIAFDSAQHTKRVGFFRLLYLTLIQGELLDYLHHTQNQTGTPCVSKHDRFATRQTNCQATKSMPSNLARHSSDQHLLHAISEANFLIILFQKQQRLTRHRIARHQVQFLLSRAHKPTEALTNLESLANALKRAFSEA